MSNKVEAAYHGGEYGEILDSSRLNYALSKDPGNGRTPEEWRAVRDEAFKDFDRAIDEFKAQALTDLADQMHDRFTASWIRGKARELTHGPRKISGAFAVTEPAQEADCGDNDL